MQLLFSYQRLVWSYLMCHPVVVSPQIFKKVRSGASLTKGISICQTNSGKRTSEPLLYTWYLPALAHESAAQQQKMTNFVPLPDVKAQIEKRLISITGWPFSLCITSRWIQNKSSAFAWPGLAKAELLLRCKRDVLHKLNGHPLHNSDTCL